MQTSRERLIEAAERLFAKRGISDVSLRTIGMAAEHRNTSAVQYHFGSKRQLVDAVFEHRMRGLDEARCKRLQALERSGRGGDRRGLVEAMVLPLAEVVKRRSYFARFLAQMLADPVQGYRVRLDREVMEGLHRITARLFGDLRHLPTAARTQRLLLIGNLMVHAFAEHERQLETGNGPITPTAALAADLVEMIVAMLGAPLSPTTSAALRRGPAAGGGRRRPLARGGTPARGRLAR